jgi:hypothetical protein
MDDGPRRPWRSRAAASPAGLVTAQETRGTGLHLACLLLLAACGGADAAAGTFSVTDSAGVAIAVSGAPAWDATPSRRWSIGETPLLDLTRTGDGPMHEFYRVEDAMTRPDGSIVVANSGSSEVRVYAATGRALGAAGREGEGPGEYRQISRLIGLPGDSIGVFSWPKRLTILAPDLSFVRTHALGDRAQAPRMLRSGDLVDLEVYPSAIEYEGRNQMIRAPAAVVRRSREGAIEDTIWVGPGYEEYMFSSGERHGSARPLLGRGPAFAVRGDLTLVGTSDSMEYRAYDAAGSLEQIVRVPGYDLSVDPGLEDAERAAYLGDDPPPFLRELVAQLPGPESRPAYAELIVDSEGYLWAGGYQSRRNYREPRAWEVFAPGGQWMGTLTTPAGFTVFEIGPDYLLGVWSDALDVEHVQRLALSRFAGG